MSSEKRAKMMRKEERMRYVRCGDVGSSVGQAMIVTGDVQRDQYVKRSYRCLIILHHTFITKYSRQMRERTAKSRHRVLVLAVASATRSSHGVSDEATVCLMLPGTLRTGEGTCIFWLKSLMVKTENNRIVSAS